MNREPDLLDWQEPVPAGATVIPFPAARRVGKARRAAQVLLNTTSQKGREAYWRRAEHNLASALASIGVPPHEIDRQLRAFSETVSIEMQRQQHRGREQA